MFNFFFLLCCSRKYPYPSHGRFFGLNPPTPLEIPVKPHTGLLKFWVLRPPTPLEFPLTFHGVGMDLIIPYFFGYKPHGFFEENLFFLIFYH